MDLSFLTENYIPIVVVACLIVGYCIKNVPLFNKVCNAYIPVIMVVLGAVISVIAQVGTNGAVTLDSIVYGAFSGLASTGLHQVFSQIVNKEG